MRRIALCLGGSLALLAVAPAMACQYSRPVFTAAPVRPEGAGQNEVRVRVDRMLSVRGVNMRAVRGTVLDDTAMAHLGDDIVIAVPTDLTGNCYYGGLADPAAIAADGSLEGYVVLQGRAASGAFFSWLADEGDRARYNAFSERRIRGQWVQARFRSAAEASR